ncbi:NXPE family member 4-like isoform X4 [Brienomyrus brachyistius]|uniref:NXPE family member 4-like isoform X4 n=1 Tax=Brienomyrus brachyistius TaxID=42636 RepID=UPI0020B1C2EC|nr:NXPE family member 4-like isoform X4 [Brienomyrus brachyistius]
MNQSLITTSDSANVRRNESRKKFFIFLCVITIVLLLAKRNLTSSFIFHRFSSTARVPHGEMTVDDVMLSLQWDLPPSPVWKSIQNTSSPAQSTASLEHPQAQYCMGDTLDVRVDMRDHSGRPKTHGGDFILARIHSPNLQASAAGAVTDLRNGSYRVRFTLLWPGEVQVSVLLMHSSEAVQALWRSRQLNYKKITHKGTFVNGSKTETSECGFQLNASKSLCEYKDERDGESYSCYTPPTLPCHSIDTISSFNTPGSALTKEEALLFNRNNIGVKIKNHFGNVNVSNCSVGQNEMDRNCVQRINPSIPCGYYWRNQWSSLYCKTGSFFTLESINRCLKGKTLYLMGDSTVRQWIEYLIKIQKEFHSFLNSVKGISSIQFVNPKEEYSIQWKLHNYPWISSYKNKPSDSSYISRNLDAIGAEGEDTVVVIAVGQHFRAYPLELFVRRLLSLRRAIQRLQARSPGTRIFIKLENTRELSSEPERFSDWHGHLQNLAQRKVFGDLQVGFVDAWEMTVAANTFVIHPNPTIIASEVAEFLSRLCHTPQDTSARPRFPVLL